MKRLNLILIVILILLIATASEAKTKTIVHINFDTGETIIKKPNQTETEILYKKVKESIKVLETEDDKYYVSNDDNDNKGVQNETDN